MPAWNCLRPTPNSLAFSFLWNISEWVKANWKLKTRHNAAINSSGAHPPPPPGQPRGICSRCQSRGLGISVPRATPGHLTHVFLNDGWVYREGHGLCQRLAWLVHQGLEKLVDVFKEMFSHFHIFLITCNHINISDHGELCFGYHKTITCVNTTWTWLFRIQN